jgi:probable rRNA maturation factor
VGRTDLRRFLKDLARQILPGQGVSCLIATDQELRTLNRKFRGQDYATDVLSFPPEDIAISFDRAAAQAAEMQHNVEDELRILMLHGLLHLAGMDHHTDKGAMARAEARWRKQLGLPSGLIERAKASGVKASA